MKKAKRVPLKAGERVSHKGKWWNVQSEFGGLVKIVDGGDSKTVRINQVQRVESIR